VNPARGFVSMQAWPQISLNDLFFGNLFFDNS
jgi:hypothetical protein